MSDNIKVAIRLRILLEREQKSGQSVNWVVKDNSIAPAGENEKTGKPYVFDTIFDQQTTTNDIFEEICKPIVDAAIEGFHGTVIAYGQSSSGKTFTMSGTKDQPGVVPLAISELFNQIERATDREFLVRSSYMQIYNETIWDLLKEEKKTIQILEDSDHNVQLLNLTEEVVKERAHVVQVINKGDRNRLVAETKQNDRSSRSHCILRIIIESRSRSKPAEEAVKVSHLNFVDLAGSEKAAENTGVRFKEGCAINKSLLTLGQVINKLGGDESSSHVNYRDSKLTRILQNALGGNSKTAIICNISPAAIEDTINTLQFASRAKTIKNKPHLNEVLSDAAVLQKYQREITRLKNQISEMGSCEELKAQHEIIKKKLKETQEAEERQKMLITKLQKMIVGHASVPMTQRRMTWGPGQEGTSIVQRLAQDVQTLPQASTETETGIVGPNDTLTELSELKNKYTLLRRDYNRLQSRLGRNLEEEEEENAVERENPSGSGVNNVDEGMEQIIEERDDLKKEVTTLRERLRVLEEKELIIPGQKRQNFHAATLHKLHEVFTYNELKSSSLCGRKPNDKLDSNRVDIVVASVLNDFPDESRNAVLKKIQSRLKSIRNNKVNENLKIRNFKRR